MHSLQLLLVVSIASNSASAFVSISHQNIVIHHSGYPSTRVSLQHVNCNKRRGYPKRSDRRSIDRGSSSSTAILSATSISIITTSISGFYKASPLLAGIIVGLISRLTQYSSRKDTELPSLNNKHINRNKSNFAMRALCSGLLLGILFEIMIHDSVIFSMCEYEYAYD